MQDVISQEVVLDVGHLHVHGDAVVTGPLLSGTHASHPQPPPALCIPRRMCPGPAIGQSRPQARRALHRDQVQGHMALPPAQEARNSSPNPILTPGQVREGDRLRNAGSMLPMKRATPLQHPSPPESQCQGYALISPGTLRPRPRSAGPAYLRGRHHPERRDLGLRARIARIVRGCRRRVRVGAGRGWGLGVGGPGCHARTHARGAGPPHLQQSRARQGWKPLLEPCRRSW